MTEELITFKNFYDIDSYDCLPLAEGVPVTPFVDFAEIAEFLKQGGSIPINPQKPGNLPLLYHMPTGYER